MKALWISLVVCGFIGGTAPMLNAGEGSKAEHGVTLNPKATPVSLEFVKEAIQKKKDLKEGKLVIVDARTSEYLMPGGPMIPGAINVPHNADMEVILKALPHKNAHILIYCGDVMCPAGANLANRLVEQGYKNVSEFSGGIRAWQEAGLTTQQKK